MKRQFVLYWMDDPRAPRKFFATTRERVAYLLKAARSRRQTIHRIHYATGFNYNIGELAINERHGFHDKHGVIAETGVTR